MIERISLWRFKKWKDSKISFRAEGCSLLVGANNSGKSSILQAASLWAFCRTVLEFEKGRDVLYKSDQQGVGLSIDDFTAVPVPSLKHLWTNLKPTKEKEKDGYTLKIGCRWRADGHPKAIIFGLALANDRLFIKVVGTNLKEDEHIPVLSYLPPFGGILDKEARQSQASRRRLIGFGQPGAVLRNILLDYFEENARKRAELKGDKSKIPAASLKELRETDPWEILIAATRSLFRTDIRIHPFNPEYHNFIRVECCRGELRKGRFSKHTGYNYRDIMVEGAGFLQWLSVFALAVNPDIDVVLLDEPDAHLHCSLQGELLDKVDSIALASKKQVLIATHSTELIRNTYAKKILEIRGGSAKYLQDDRQKVGLLAGIGAEYSPRLHRLQKCHRLLLLESELDERLLKIWAQTLDIEFPADDRLVIWHWPSGHVERKQLFSQLKAEIPELKAISIRDKDDEAWESTTQSLLDKTHTGGPAGLRCLKWRRREIENYLIHPRAIARAAEINLDEVKSFLSDEHSVSVGKSFLKSDCHSALAQLDGKALFISGRESLDAKFNVSREEIASQMRSTEIPEDVSTALRTIAKLAK